MSNPGSESPFSGDQPPVWPNYNRVQQANFVNASSQGVDVTEILPETISNLNFVDRQFSHTARLH
jgi:hypothetical protein